MSFYLALAAVNIACFVPLYVLNFRHAPNPFEFLAASALDRKKLKFLYAKPKCTDPFRINFDYTFLVLLAAALDFSPPWLVVLAAGVLAIGFIEIQYATVMLSIFKRAPAIRADIALLKVGLNVAQRQLYWMVPAVIATLAAIVVAAYAVTTWLFELMPEDRAWPLVGALLLLPPSFYHWRNFLHGEFLARTVYSPALHFLRNLEYSGRVAAVLAKDKAHFERHNHFKDVTLCGAPNVVIICVESYGGIVYRNESWGREVGGLLRDYETRLADAGYGFASTYSEPPIFAGGSWLSYASFAYGFRCADVQLFDGLFAHDHAFGAYESVFHVLKRNGYYNLLLCPLAGVDTRTIDWATITRCFQSDRNIDFASVGYRGQCVPYFGITRLFSPPDQYSLNFAYESARERSARFSLFFCTLNSHIPWNSPECAAADWRALDDPGLRLLEGTRGRRVEERYVSAIRYQLDYILRFVLDRADDGSLVIVFGDHQPPFITPESMGKHTPVHVITRNRKFLDVFAAHGFHPSMDLTGITPVPIKHEGFLSLFLRAMNTAYGRDPGLDVEYLADGVPLFGELRADA